MGELGMIRARCLSALGRAADARAAASAAVVLLSDPEVRGWAEFLASIGVEVPTVPAGPVAATDPATAPAAGSAEAAVGAPAAEPPGRVWRWLADEERAHTALEERVRETTSPRRRPLTELSTAGQ